MVSIYLALTELVVHLIQTLKFNMAVFENVTKLKQQLIVFVNLNIFEAMLLSSAHDCAS